MHSVWWRCCCQRDGGPRALGRSLSRLAATPPGMGGRIAGRVSRGGEDPAGSADCCCQCHAQDADSVRSSPTGPGPAKSCEKRSGGFPTPTPSGGLESPPLLFAQLRPHRGPAKATVAKRGTGMSPLRGCPCFLRRRLVGATLVVALLPNGATVRRPLLGHYRTGGWSGDSAGERCDPAGHPQRVPLRSSGMGSF